MAITSTYANLALDDLFTGTFYAALHTASGEVAASGYARVPFTFAAASAGGTSNAIDIVFPAALAAWGTVTKFAVYTASTAGTLMFTVLLSSSEVVGITQIVSIDAGVMTVLLA